MDPDEWHREYKKFEERMRVIDNIYRRKIELINASRRASTFWMCGYCVLLFAGILFQNYAVMLAGAACMVWMLISLVLLHVTLQRMKYPTDE